MAKLYPMPGESLLQRTEEGTRRILDEMRHTVIRDVVMPSAKNAKGDLLFSEVGCFRHMVEGGKANTYFDMPFC